MAVVNPFQQINASLPPLAPEPALGFNPGDMDTSAPAQVPQGKRPQVFGPTPQDRQETMLSGRLEKDYQKDLHPFGTPENHPGTMGKIAHALSWATGGPNRRLMEESGIEGKLNKLAALQSEDTLRGAQAGNLNSEAGKNTEETAEMPGKTASEEGLQGAQKGNLESETRERDVNAAMGPTLIMGHAHAVADAIKNGRDPSSDPLVQEYVRQIQEIQKPVAPKGMEHVSFESGGKQMEGNYDPNKGVYMDLQGNVVKDAKPIPSAAASGAVTFIAPDPNTPGGGIVQRLGPGAHVAPGSETPGGVNTLSVNDAKSTQTAQQRVKSLDTSLNMMQQFAKENTGAGDFGILMNYAGAVKPDNIGKLRWQKNEQDYIEGLRSTVGDIDAWRERIATGERLPPKQREEMIHAVQIVRDATARENGPRGQSQGGPPQGEPAVGTVENGYRFKGGDPAKQENWEQVKK